MTRLVPIALAAGALLAGVLLLLFSDAGTERGGVSERQSRGNVDPEAAPDLNETRTVPGVVIDTVGVPVGDATVRCLELADVDASVDPEGAFQLRIPDRGDVRIEARSPGYMVERLTLAAKVTRFIRIVLVEGGSVVFEVRGERGLPVAGADVRLCALMTGPGVRSDPGGSEFRISTDSFGSVRFGPIRPGTFSISIDAEGYAPLHQDWECRAGPESTLVLSLAPGADLSGRAFGPDGKPLQDAIVQAIGTPERTVASDQNGEFRIVDLPTGTAYIRATSTRFGETYYGEADGLSEPKGVHVEPRKPVEGVEIRFGDAGRVNGRVVDDLGEPVVAAEVTLRLLGCSGRSPVSVVTDNRGEFHAGPIGLIDARPLHVWIQSSSHVRKSLEVSVFEPGRALDLGTVVLERLASVSGSLVGPDGNSEDPGWVRCGDRATVASEDGRFECVGIAPGQVELNAGSGRGSEQFRAAPITLTLAPGESVRGMRIELGPTHEIVGRVVWSNGEPFAAARVGVVSSDRGEGKITPLNLKDVIAGEDGWFVLAGLVPGKYRVGLLNLDDDGFRLARSPEPVEVRAGASEVSLVLPHRAATLRGEVVVGADGSPVQKFFVRFVPATSSESLRPVTRWIESDEGRLVQCLALDCAWTVEVKAPHHPLTRVGPLELEAGVCADLGRIRVDAGGVLFGFLRDRRGQPATAARIDVIDLASKRLHTELRTDAEGLFRSPSLSPGDYLLVGLSPGNAPAMARALELRSGEEREVKLTLPAPAQLLVRVRDGKGRLVPDATLSHIPEWLAGMPRPVVRRILNAQPERTPSDAEGVIRRSRLPPGKCSLIVSAAGYHDEVLQMNLAAGAAREVEAQLARRAD